MSRTLSPLFPPSRPPSKARQRALDELRLGMMRHAAGELPPELARRAVDQGLLVALAGEVLGCANARGAALLAATGDFNALARLTSEVGRTTGLHLGRAALDTLSVRSRGQTALPFPALEEFVHARDPFGELAQLLRARTPIESHGRWSLEPSAARRDDGGYYTPYPLARRLVSRVVSPGFDEVPSVIDPACGAGTFLTAAFDVIHAILQARHAADPALVVNPIAWTIAALHGVDIDETALVAARLSLATRAVLAERQSGERGQMTLFGQSETYGPLIEDRLRLGDALSEPPNDTTPGTERLRRRLLARDEPGRLPVAPEPLPVRWDADFPLRFSDEEGAWRDGGGFDLVITNPPFVPVDRIPAKRRAALMKTLETAQRRFDLFIGFVERASTLLAHGGHATLLIPRTFLTEANAENCRRMLLDRMTVERIEELGAVSFQGARVECIALSFIARRPTDTCAVEIYRKGVRTPSAVPLLSFRRAPRRMMRLELSEPQADECQRLAERSIPLGRFFAAAWGARGSPVRDFHLNDDTHPLARPMLKGSDIEPFTTRPPSKWLLYDTEKLYRPSRPEFFEHPKLVVRKVTGARGLIIAVDEAHRYTDDSLACVVRKADLAGIPVAVRKRHKLSIAPSQIEPSRAYDLHLVCALLQTPLVQTWYRVQLGGGLNVFPDQVEALPLPRPERLAMPEAGELIALAKNAANGGVFDAERADALARALYGL